MQHGIQLQNKWNKLILVCFVMLWHDFKLAVPAQKPSSNIKGLYPVMAAAGRTSY